MNENNLKLQHSKSGSDLIEYFSSLNEDGGLQFIKITERIFAILFQSGSDVIYRNNIKFICERLKKIYFDKYKIFNFSQKRSDLGRANQQGIVLEFGWPEPLSPPLDRLCSICKQLENHLNNSKENIAIIHCKGGIYRAGIVISAFMNYTNICSSEENLPDRFSMKLFTEKYMEINTQPSHKRYVNYFINLLNGTTKVYPTPIYLKYISLYKLFSGQTVKLKLYERMKPIWSSGKIILKENTLIEISENNNNKSLRGDILLKCYQSIMTTINEKQLLFQCQFNTCALGMESFNKKIFFSKIELDCLNNSIFIDNNANLELAFELNKQNNNNNNNNRRGKSASPRSYQHLNNINNNNIGNSCGGGGGDFSRADSYENFEKAEDERSLSVPIGINTREYLNENNFQKLNDEINRIENGIEETNLNNKSKLSATDGADSGIGSDSPKVLSNQLNLPNQYKEEQKVLEEINEQKSDSKLNLINMPFSPPPPPPVPPKSSLHKHSSDKNEEESDQQILIQNHNLNEEKEEENDLMRSAFEDSTIGRDHSVLPPGARSSSRSRHSPHTTIDGGGGGGGTSTSSSDEKPRRRVIISPMVQPQLAPKKPSLKRRTSVIEPADLELSPLEAKMALENFGLQSSSSETNRKPEIPKWEAEIDKLTGEKVESHHRPRRASTTGTPVGHIQRDYIRSPSATQTKRSPQDDWNYYNKQNKIQEKTLNWPTITSNNYQKSNENILTTLSDKWPNLTTQRLSRSQIPSRDNYYQMTTSMPSSTIQTPSTEQPLIFEQAKRATPTFLQQKIYSNSYSPSIGNRRRPIPGVRPSPRSNEMDTLCDPEFYLSYSSLPQNKQNEKEFLSKSVPNKNEFNQMALKELQRDDVKELLAQHIPNNNNNKGNNYFNSSIRRSQTPQNPLITCKELRKPLIDEYRTRNCRSVNSTPLIGNKRLFLYKEFDEPLTDPESAEDWLHSKLETLKGRKHLKEEPFARNKYEAEKLLLEELKNKATKLISEKNIKENEGGDPLEEYKKEEQRLKNTKLPFLTLDGLRKANKYLQNERAKQNIFGQQNSSSSSFKNFSSDLIIQQQRSLSSIPINNNNSIINSSSSSIPYNTNKRGATPTGQIMIEKPPTPPPLIKGIENRERSKSPHNSKIFLNNSSTSLKKSSFDEIEEPLQSTSSLSAVNPNLLALRQSLYEKERQRMGLSYNNELIDSKLNKWPLPELIKENNQNSSSNNKYSTSVKPILKRNTLQKNNTNGNESPTIFNNKQNCNNNNNNEKNLSQQQKELLNNWIIDRSDTPQFPLISDRETPLPYHPLLYKNEDYNQKLTKNNLINQSVLINRTDSLTPHSMYGNGSSGNGFGRRSSLNSIDSADVIHHHPIFVKDTSRFWYKPKISREEAISILKNKSPGTFIVRNSNSFPGAFGLALKVSQPPVGVPPSDGNELVRHFLIEPSPKGVRLKGCSNEPVFGTLSALVYQHSITPLALPCRLILPSIDPASTSENINSNQALLERGAACNVTYLCSVDTESLTGPEAVRRSTSFALKLLLRHELHSVPVHIKVSLQGITLTDNTRTLFFRRHYPVNSITFAGIDPENRVFDNNNVIQLPPTYVRQAPLFGFVAHKTLTNGFNGGNIENSCHIFAELDPDQPASAVVRFITNVMMPAGRSQLQQRHQQNNLV